MDDNAVTGEIRKATPAESRPLTWDEMKRVEPILEVLEKAAPRLGAAGRDYYCAHETWVDFLKPIVSRVVGYYRGRYRQARLEDSRSNLDVVVDVMKGYPAATPEEYWLRSSSAYNVAIDSLLATLPDCRNCTCLSVE